ncbi:hypothetical protein E2C01_017107 [Portunus trituberculatus]|uniref:Uncharacterized protein n=1 Tax=Portunus trituberculatus TaxID=210409 RepID=A0A5B7DSA5_PORTR|nr:hypothetical protein [Portunus trituberculatus]
MGISITLISAAFYTNLTSPTSCTTPPTSSHPPSYHDWPEPAMFASQTAASPGSNSHLSILWTPTPTTLCRWSAVTKT